MRAIELGTHPEYYSFNAESTAESQSTTEVMLDKFVEYGETVTITEQLYPDVHLPRPFLINETPKVDSYVSYEGQPVNSMYPELSFFPYSDGDNPDKIFVNARSEWHEDMETGKMIRVPMLKDGNIVPEFAELPTDVFDNPFRIANPVDENSVLKMAVILDRANHRLQGDDGNTVAGDDSEMLMDPDLIVDDEAIVVDNVYKQDRRAA